MATKVEMVRLVLLRESLRKQAEEFEMLKSIYSMPGEFQTDNPLLINVIQEFLSGNRSSVDEKLDFRLKVQLTETVKMELSVLLGQLYPSHDLPMFTVRTDSLSKAQENLVKQAIENYINTEIDKSDPYIYQVVSWLQDHIEEIALTPSVEEVKKEEEALRMERNWLWSHHIYSKIKRQNIMKLCKGNHLSGFMWSGKPGVICIEGTLESVQEVTRTIKSWQWQKLKIVKVENCDNDIDEKFLRFKGFEEIMEEDDGNGEDVKMNTSRFFKYLDSHQSGNMKMELFGFD